jgi:hypothetical protein
MLFELLVEASGSTLTLNPAGFDLPGCLRGLRRARTLPRQDSRVPFAFTGDSAQCQRNDSEGHLEPLPNFLALPDRVIGGRA